MADTPVYFLDSGVVIYLSYINHQKSNNVSNETIINSMISSNRHNIDRNVAEALIKMYDENQEGKSVFCLVPTVFKETLVDKQNKSDSTYKASFDFISKNCMVAMPENIAEFTLKTALLANMLKENVTTLGEDFHTDVLGNSVDVNIEDRILLAQFLIMATDSQHNFEMVNANGGMWTNYNNQDYLGNVVTNIRRWTVDFETETRDSILEFFDGQTGTFIAPNAKFVHINGEDFGLKEGFGSELVGGRVSFDDKHDTVDQITATFNEYLKITTPVDERGSVAQIDQSIIATPDELVY